MTSVKNAPLRDITITSFFQAPAVREIFTVDICLAHDEALFNKHVETEQVSGHATRDSRVELRTMITLSSLQVQPGHRLSAKFEPLLRLADGWLDGQGVAPHKTRLAEVAGKMVEWYPDDLPLPSIVPTDEGNLLFEWDGEGDPSVELDLYSMRASFHAFLPDETEIEREFSLANEASWREFFAFLHERLCPFPA